MIENHIRGGAGAVEMPCANKDGLVPTVNHRGWMMTHIDPWCQLFIQCAAQSPNWTMDIGCAFGVHTLAALKAGARVIANDMDARHLELLLSRVPKGLRDRVQTRTGIFPYIEVTASSIGAVLCARVFHFMDGATIERAAAKMFDILVPGGKAFIVADSPYLATLTGFIPDYEKRKANNERWPGCVPDMRLYEPNEVAAGIIPEMMHFLDPDVLTRTFADAGFTVETKEFFARNEGFSEFLRLDGREGVVLIARKS